MVKVNKNRQAQSYDTMQVFLAAAVASRINRGEYIKYTVEERTETGELAVVKQSNRDILAQVLAGTLEVTDQDKILAEQVVTYCKGYTIKLLSGKLLNEYEQKALQLASSDTVTDRDFALIASLPSGWLRTEKRMQADDRLYNCDKASVGEVGKKVTVTGEVIKSIFSRNWNTYYITMITTDNKAVFFGFKDNIAPGSKITIEGKVKKFMEDAKTQLNYVKII